MEVKMNDVVSINVNDIVVPEDVHYIGDWKEYNLENYPFPHILNKVLTGCGYTEGCLENEQNLILLSPRKFLLENKRDQHYGELNIFYAENKTEKLVDYEKDLSKIDRKIKKETLLSEEECREQSKQIERLKNNIKEHRLRCRLSRKPCKILVTYDSFRHVIEALEEDIKNFQIVVDEFQSIFIDARFKSEAELELMNHLNEIQDKYKVTKICYVSATPMLENYLIKLNEFKNLPYYRFDWETASPGRTKKPKIDIKYTSRPLSESVNNVIEKYLNEKFEVRVVDLGEGKQEVIKSDEAVLFFNSVKGISQAIRTNKLLPEQCNVLCAKTPENERRIRDAFNDVLKTLGTKKEGLIKKGTKMIGKIPMKGEPHKMFTFCTRTVYLGADFYSTKARSFIFSDSNVDCLSVDISLDLEQILGRQRLPENPWRNMATLYVRTTSLGKKTSREEFQTILDKKVKESEGLLEAYNNAKDEHKLMIAKKYQTAAAVEHYRGDYVAVNRHAGSTLVPVFNNLMMLSELRAFEVQQEDYADRFTVLSSIEGRGVEFENEIDQEVRDFIGEFEGIRQTTNRLKVLVSFYNSHKDNQKVIDEIFDLIPSKYKDYFTILGPDKIRSLSYQESDIKKEMIIKCANTNSADQVKEQIYNIFNVGEKYSKIFIRENLENIYNSSGYTKIPKASQLGNYFIIKPTKVKDKSGNWISGLEIIAKK